MQNPTRLTAMFSAMACEFFRRSWAPTLGVMTWSIIGYSFIYGMLAYHTDLSFNNEVGRQLFFSFFMATLLGCAFVALSGHDPFERNFTLPISTRLIVCMRMIIGILSGAIIYLSVSAFANICFQASWPILGPTLYVMVVVAWAQAMFWSIGNSHLLKLIGGIVSIFPIGFWLADRFGDWPFSSDWILSIGDVATMTVAMMLIIPLGIWGASRARRGDAPDLSLLAQWIERQISAWTASVGRIRTREQALFWYTFKQKGLLLPIALMIAVGVVSFVCFVERLTPGGCVEGLIGFTMLSIFGAQFSGMFLGHQTNDNSFQTYRATLPVSDVEIATAYLKANALACLLAMLVWPIGVGVFFSEAISNGFFEAFMADLQSRFRFVHNPNALSLVAFALTALLGFWTFSASATSLFLGQSRVITVVVWAITTTAMALAVAYATLEEWRDWIFNFSIGLITVVSLTITWTSHMVAIYQQRLRVRTFVISLSIAGSLGTFYSCVVFGNELSMSRQLLIFGIFSLPLLPVALTPLSVTWNRHR